MLKNDHFPASPLFSTMLLRWHATENHREMPWKGERDPYRIWLSEIILQQTRVDQGLAYYQRFVGEFPTIRHLAAAPDDRVFKLWEGLGYYSRCRNLLATARFVANELDGIFPTDYADILALKGVGPYTAAAIASFAFGLPHAVLDGNVFRVLARVFGADLPIDSTPGRKFFERLADTLLDRDSPALYNQSIMDFGATICKPALPRCDQCIFNQVCYAYINQEIDRLPVKEAKTKVRRRWFYYLVMQLGSQTYIRQRTEKGIWQQLYEFPLIETDQEEEIGGILQQAETQHWLVPGKYQVHDVSTVIRQQLSHQSIAGRFIRVKLNTAPLPDQNWKLVTMEEMNKLAFPGFINQYLGTPPKDAS